jgi:Zn-finger domain-containing protein
MKAKAGEFIKTDSGEVIWGSEAFIDELFKTLYGNKFRDEIWSYHDALQKIKNLVQQVEVTNGSN